MKKLLFCLTLLLTGSFLFAQETESTKKKGTAEATTKNKGKNVVVDAFPDLYPEVVREGNTMKITIFNEGNPGIKAPASKTRCMIGEMVKLFDTPALMQGDSKEVSWELPPSYQAMDVKIKVVADYKAGNNGVNNGTFRETNEMNNKYEKTFLADPSHEMQQSKEPSSKKKGGG